MAQGQHPFNVYKYIPKPNNLKR